MSAAIPFPGAGLPARGEDGSGSHDAPPVADPLAPALLGRTMALTLDGRTQTVAFAPDGAPRLQPASTAVPGTTPGADLPALLASRAAAATAAAVTESLLALLAPPRR